jgi:hypothetical protein
MFGRLVEFDKLIPNIVQRRIETRLIFTFHSAAGAQEPGRLLDSFVERRSKVSVRSAEPDVPRRARA